MRQNVLLVIACLALATPWAQAQSSDPGDLFVNAYMAVQAGEKAEQAGSVKEATSKYHYAAQILDQIGTRFPSWQPSIIDYRKKRTAEAISRMQDKIAHVGGAKTQPVEAVAPPSGLTTVPGLPEVTFPPPDILPDTPPPSHTASRRTPDRRTPVEPELPASTPLKEFEQRVEKLQKELERVRAEADRAQKDKTELAKQLQEAGAARDQSEKKRSSLEQRSAATEAALAKAKEEGKSDSDQAKKLSGDLAETKKQLRDWKLEADAEAEYRQQLGDRVRAAQTKISRLNIEKAAAEQASAEAPAKISEVQRQLDETRKEKDDLVIKLARTETDLKTAMSARDEALAQVARMKETQKQVDKLLGDNATLMAKLSDAEKNITHFKADGVKKDEEIASLRKDTSSLKDQLAKAQKDSVDSLKQMDDLQQRLTQATAQIATMKADGAKAVAERTRLQEENQILRGIVLRGQKEEARRAQTKKLVFGELAKLENKSKVLMDQIENLSGPIVKLTEKERSLFKKPELQISDTEISLTAARSDERTSATEPPLPEAEPAAPVPATSATKVADGKQAEAVPKAAPPTEAPRTATPAPLSAQGKATKAKPAPAPAPTVPPPPAPETTPKPALSLDTGVKALAKNTGPFSSLPDGLNPKGIGAPMEKTAPAPAPASSKTTVAKTTAAKTATPTPEPLPTKMPEKAPEPATPAETPLAPSSSGTANVSSVVMNLPPELAAEARTGKDQFEKGNYRDAEKIYERILVKAPNNLYTLSNLGVVYFRSVKFPRAEEMFKKAIAIAPEDGFSHCTLGIVYYSQQKYDEAVNELTKALAINPKNATAHNYLGITASQKGWQEAAQKELETATVLDPAYADAHFNLAVVFATQQPPNKENARKFYKKATELGADPDTALEQLIK